MRQSDLLQKTVSTFEGIVAVTLKHGMIISQYRPFQLYQFQCQMIIHLVLFEITKCLILPLTTLYEYVYSDCSANYIGKTERTFHDHVDTGRKLNIHKTFRRRPGRLLNVLCTFNLRPVHTGERSLEHDKSDKKGIINQPHDECTGLEYIKNMRNITCNRCFP